MINKNDKNLNFMFVSPMNLKESGKYKNINVERILIRRRGGVGYAFGI